MPDVVVVEGGEVLSPMSGVSSPSVAFTSGDALIQENSPEVQLPGCWERFCGALGRIKQAIVAAEIPLIKAGVATAIPSSQLVAIGTLMGDRDVENAGRFAFLVPNFIRLFEALARVDKAPLELCSEVASGIGFAMDAAADYVGEEGSKERDITRAIGLGLVVMASAFWLGSGLRKESERKNPRTMPAKVTSSMASLGLFTAAVLGVNSTIQEILNASARGVLYPLTDVLWWKEANVLQSRSSGQLMQEIESVRERESLVCRDSDGSVVRELGARTEEIGGEDRNV